MGHDRPAFLNDHRIFGRLIMPSPAYIEMALAGAARISKLDKTESVPCEVTDLTIREPLFLPEEDSCPIQMIFEDSAEQSMGFRICSREKSAEVERRSGGHTLQAAYALALTPSQADSKDLESRGNLDTVF